MNRTEEPLLSIEFETEIVHWRGPAPFLFAPVPEGYVEEVRRAARLASYGWGCVPVKAGIGGIDFTTSLFPRNGTYMIPIKVAVQKGAGIGLGDTVHVAMRIEDRAF